MTAAADRPVRNRGSAPPTSLPPAGTARRSAALLATMIWLAVLAALTTITACTGTEVPQAGPAQRAAGDPGGWPAAIPAADEQAISATLDRINATAGGAVARQQAVLAAVVDPGSAPTLHRCPPTTSTLRFEPVYSGLRPTPDWRPEAGALSGTRYALPVLIRTYTGDRMTGTDLTTLHLGVQGGAAWLTALCVN